MRKFLARFRLELKYIALGVAALLSVYALAWVGVLDGFEQRVSAFMLDLIEWGWVGMFAVAFLSNLTLVMPLPYGLPLFTLVLYAGSALDALRLGAGAGLGAGLGAVCAYTVAHNVLTQVEEPEHSWLFRAVRYCTDRWPRSVPVVVWFSAATPAPEGMITTSLAMVRYPLGVIVLLVLSGKIVGNLAISQLYYFATDSFAGQVSDNLYVTATLVLIIVFVMIIAYQIEKSLVLRAERRAHAARERAQTPTV